MCSNLNILLSCILYIYSSGDIAFRILETIKSTKRLAMQDVLEDELQEQTQIYVCDINPNMLTVGKKRALEKGELKITNLLLRPRCWQRNLSCPSKSKLFANNHRLWRRPVSCMGGGRCRSLEFWQWFNGWLHNCIWYQECYTHRKGTIWSL